MTEAKKFDKGKPPIALIPRKALELEAMVMLHGEAKYGLHNWRQGKGLSRLRLLSAALRHILADADGETMDGESGLPHLAHARCMLAFALEGAGEDDRFRATIEDVEDKDDSHWRKTNVEQESTVPQDPEGQESSEDAAYLGGRGPSY